ncbi:hypothetical protein [Longispora fulva]|uniref:Uncharacterized protein n=1 Tax=Longispora fulva TaxID=619741 RepID=A0A8J7KPI0_9ACTN|nr:hypothetical protein [Longispora fulva]MBG6136317.1 hypothetical protein [Longispora fulva]
MTSGSARGKRNGRLLLWDLDDTLISYSGIGAETATEVAAAALRTPISNQPVRSGRTAWAILLDLLELNGMTADQAAATAPGLLPELAGMVVDERGVDAPKREAGALVDFLLAQLRWLGAHPAAGDLCDELADLVHSADRAAYPSPPGRTQLGRRCLFTECGGVLDGVVHVDRPERSRIECDLDPAAHRWARDQWMAVRRAAKVTPVARPVGMAA